MRRMKIMFIASGLARGGAEAQLVYLAKELVRRGHAVAIYLLNRELDRLSELEGSGVEIEIDEKRCKIDFALLGRAKRYARRFGAEVIQGYLYDGNFYACLIGAITKTPVLISERSNNYRLNRFQNLGRFFISRVAAGVVANSHSGAEFAGKLYSIAPDKRFTVWNGIDLKLVNDRIANCTQRYKEVFFGTDQVAVATMVGNIREAKDFMLALEVAERLCDLSPGWRVLFVGDDIRETGDYKQQVIARHEQMRHRDRILFVGKREDALEIIAQCDVLFSTSQREGFPNVVLEAMACGVPVVSTDYSDIRKILPLGWQVDGERNPVAIAGAIFRAKANSKSIAEIQKKWIETYATMEALATNFEAIFCKPIDSQTPNHPQITAQTKY